MRYTHNSSFLMLAVLSVVANGGCQSQRNFKSPDDAVVALNDAVQRQDVKELHRLFGPRVDELKSGDPDMDKDDMIIFARRLTTECNVQQDSPDHVTLLIGEEQWPFAVPLTKDGQAWRFDTDAGIDETTNRRIGRNERLTIEACRTFIDAQVEYFARDPDGSGVQHYAAKVMSTEGAKDGLYWPVTGNEDPSPIGPVLAYAAVRKESSGQFIPFNGYFYRLVTNQGATAPGGAMDYLVDGKLTRGWAAVAYPAKYGESGIMSFLFGSTGVIYQQDLGNDTSSATVQITVFDPGPDWTPVEN